MKIDILTLFPEMFDGVLQHSILKRAQDLGAFQPNLVNFREFTTNKHKKSMIIHTAAELAWSWPPADIRCNRACDRRISQAPCHTHVPAG